MQRRRQIINPDQQPSHRNYRRDSSQYERDEERDFANGADYIDRRFRHRDDDDDFYNSSNNAWPSNHRDQRTYGDELYTPSFDYGYQRDEYYEMDPSHRGHRTEAAVGYGNDYSSQGRDFENWLHNQGRYRNTNNDFYRQAEFNNRTNNRGLPNRGFEEGMYDYRDEQRYQRAPEGRSLSQSRDQYLRENGRPDMDKRYNRSDRHMEIVRPFKREEDYGRNDFNRSVGYGSSEMVYHNDEHPDDLDRY